MFGSNTWVERLWGLGVYKQKAILESSGGDFHRICCVDAVASGRHLSNFFATDQSYAVFLACGEKFTQTVLF
jgi:hypothetical protein